MKKIKSWIYLAIYLIILFGLCKTCITDHINGSSPSKINNLETMISDNTVVQAKLSNEYKETTIKIMKIPVKTYEFDYTFQLDNKTFSDKITLYDLPKSQYIKLYYLKNNPNIVSQNPQADLEEEMKKDTTNANLIWGIIFGILGLLVLIATIGKISKAIKQKQKNIKQETNQSTQKEPIKKPEDTVNLNEEEKKIDKEDHSRFMPK